MLAHGGYRGRRDDDWGAPPAASSGGPSLLQAGGYAGPPSPAAAASAAAPAQSGGEPVIPVGFFYFIGSAIFQNQSASMPIFFPKMAYFMCS